MSLKWLYLVHSIIATFPPPQDAIVALLQHFIPRRVKNYTKVMVASRKHLCNKKFSMQQIAIGSSKSRQSHPKIKINTRRRRITFAALVNTFATWKQD
jgi:hypothetical protein